MLRRLDDGGALPRGADVARRSMAQEEIAALLAFAAQGDSAGMAAGYLRKFREEFRMPQPRGITVLDAQLNPNFHRSTGRVRAGTGYEDVWTGARPVADTSAADAQARGAFGARWLAGAAAVNRAQLSEAQLVLAGRAIGLWVGRKPSGYATAFGGGIVVDEHRFDGAGIFLARPLNLPLLGALRFESQLSRIDNVLNMNGSEHPTRPYFWSARGSFEPFARLRLGVNRGMMFGGKGNYPVTAARVLKNLVGITNSDQESGFAKQLISVDARYRAPTGAMPATLYIDWGADDAFGGWWHTPAIIGGIEVTPSRHADWMIGLERAEFATNHRTNSLWYQNPWLRGSWADDGAVLGHPLGGNGKEWRAFATGGSPLNAYSGALSAYTRTRGGQNVFAPEHGGRSAGAEGKADIRINATTRIELQGSVERGTTAPRWTTTAARAGVRYRF